MNKPNKETIEKCVNELTDFNCLVDDLHEHLNVLRKIIADSGYHDFNDYYLSKVSQSLNNIVRDTEACMLEIEEGKTTF